MTRASKKQWTVFGIAMAWLFLLLWPLLDIRPDGTLGFAKSFKVWLPIFSAGLLIMFLLELKRKGVFKPVIDPLQQARAWGDEQFKRVPTAVWFVIGFAFMAAFPTFADRHSLDTMTNVLIYVCLGLGLNIVVGLCGLLDLGFIAFYGVGAYSYALLSVTYGLSFWICLPIAALFAAIAGCIVGYPTLRMRGDYLAIVTLGFGEIIRIILNNWMSLTNGPNGILGIKPPTFPIFDFTNGFHIVWFEFKRLGSLYYIIFGLAIFTIIAVHRLNFSRIGRAWEAIREDETAAELMGVNTFMLKLLAYASGAVFGGLAGAFFAARMRFVSPESFTFLESAMVLAMVVLGGMGSIPGIILGALALVVLPESFRGFELYRMLAFGGAMTLMMLVKPSGLIPAKRMGKRSDDSD